MEPSLRVSPGHVSLTIKNPVEQAEQRFFDSLVAFRLRLVIFTTETAVYFREIEM